MSPTNFVPHSRQISGEKVQLSEMAGVMNSLRLAALLALCLACSGCALTKGINNYLEYNDDSNDFVMGWRNEVWARQAGHEQKQFFDGHQERGAFGAGFRDGYMDVASGGNGCPPGVPPRKYWTWKYQTPEGQAKVAAWFEGYPHGARVADEQGAGSFQDIQVSYAIENQYSSEFQAGGVPHLEDGRQFLPGQQPEPTPHEVLPADVPTHELFEPQTRAGQPYPSQRHHAVQASFETHPQHSPESRAGLIRTVKAAAPWQPGRDVKKLMPTEYRTTYPLPQTALPVGAASFPNGTWMPQEQGPHPQTQASISRFP